jgi:hypothetical protein
MLNHIFNVMRDIRREHKERNVTENRTSKVIHLPTDYVVNVRVDTEGWTDDLKLSIKFEESQDNVAFREIGTFLIPDAHHGILFCKFTEYLRYTIIIDGKEPNLNVTVQF